MFNLFLMMFLSLPCLKKPIGMIHTTPAAESTQVALQDVLRLLRSEVRNVFFLGGEVVTQPGLNATKTITRYTSYQYCYITIDVGIAMLVWAIADITTIVRLVLLPYD